MTRLQHTLLLGLAALLGACATADTVNMVPTGLTVEQRLAGSVELSASGTGKRLGIGSSRVSGAALEDALSAAVLEASVFQSVASEGGDYRLHVSVDELTSPEASLDMHVDATLTWSLTDASGKQTLWRAPIKTGHTARPEDAFDVKEREQVAIEKALQENLREGIRRLSELDLPKR